jgi:hypothetical protein
LPAALVNGHAMAGSLERVPFHLPWAPAPLGILAKPTSPTMCAGSRFCVR